MITYSLYKPFVSLNMFSCELIAEKEKFRTFQDMIVFENHYLSDKHKGKNKPTPLKPFTFSTPL